MQPFPKDEKGHNFKLQHGFGSQLFHSCATVRHCLKSFKVKIQLDHYCIGDGSYIDVYKSYKSNLATDIIPGMRKGEQGVNKRYKSAQQY